jgi:hypothetical protein
MIQDAGDFEILPSLGEDMSEDFPPQPPKIESQVLSLFKRMFIRGNSLKTEDES